MGKTFPTECPHGRILDWGDFGDPDNPETAAEHCDECETENEPFLRGTVWDAGGGRVNVLVDRSTPQYPDIGARVELYLLPSDEGGTDDAGRPVPLSRWPYDDGSQD